MFSDRRPPAAVESHRDPSHTNLLLISTLIGATVEEIERNNSDSFNSVPSVLQVVVLSCMQIKEEGVSPIDWNYYRTSGFLEYLRLSHTERTGELVDIGLMTSELSVENFY